MDNNFLGVGGHIAEPHGGEAGAGEVEGGDVGLAVWDTAGVIVMTLDCQHGHPAPVVGGEQRGLQLFLGDHIPDTSKPMSQQEEAPHQKDENEATVLGISRKCISVYFDVISRFLSVNEEYLFIIH